MEIQLWQIILTSIASFMAGMLFMWKVFEYWIEETFHTKRRLGKK